MTTPLQSITNLTGNTVTEAQAKAWFTDLRAYLAGLFGEDGLPATARVTLGILASVASNITFTPVGNLVATTVQAALVELDTEKGGLALANTWTQTQNMSISGNAATATNATNASNAANAANAATAATASKVTTTSFVVEEIAGILYFKTGSTVLMTLTQTGDLSVKGNVTGYTGSV
jgi:hypothetical protein